MTDTVLVALLMLWIVALIRWRDYKRLWRAAEAENKRLSAELEEVMAENDAIWEDWCKRNGVDLAQGHWPEILEKRG